MSVGLAVCSWCLCVPMTVAQCVVPSVCRSRPHCTLVPGCPGVCFYLDYLFQCPHISVPVPVLGSSVSVCSGACVPLRPTYRIVSLSVSIHVCLHICLPPVYTSHCLSVLQDSMSVRLCFKDYISQSVSYFCVCQCQCTSVYINSSVCLLHCESPSLCVSVSSIARDSASRHLCVSELHSLRASDSLLPFA